MWCNVCQRRRSRRRHCQPNTRLTRSDRGRDLAAADSGVRLPDALCKSSLSALGGFRKEAKIQRSEAADAIQQWVAFCVTYARNGGICTLAHIINPTGLWRGGGPGGPVGNIILFIV